MRPQQPGREPLPPRPTTNQSPTPVQSRHMLEIYHTLTGKSFTHAQLCQPWPVRLIALLQGDGAWLVDAYNSEWMRERWQSLVDCLDIEPGLPGGGRAMVHVAGEHLAAAGPTAEQLQGLKAAVRAYLLKAQGMNG